jgi:hypothetical protein
MHMGSLWPKATAARAGLTQLANPASRPLTAHGARGATIARPVRAQCTITTRGHG